MIGSMGVRTLFVLASALLWLAAGDSLSGTGRAFGDDPPPIPKGGGDRKDGVPTPPEGESDKRPLQDPTRPSPRLREILSVPKGSPTTPGSTPEAAPQIPTIVLKGRIVSSSTAPAALLEIDGRLQIVRKDNQFGSGRLVFRVVEITSTQVKIEVEPIKQTLILQ